jgi:hypothetical protein
MSIDLDVDNEGVMTIRSAPRVGGKSVCNRGRGIFLKAARRCPFGPVCAVFRNEKHRAALQIPTQFAQANCSAHEFLRNSGQRDLNPRPTGPKPVALAKLRYAP